MFSDEDINSAREAYQKNSNDGLDITPFEDKYLTPVGYDLRVGIEGYSWKKKSTINIEVDKKIEIESGDTVVIRTLESVTLSKQVSATIHSMVSKVVTKGLSDISTTIDPGWKGKLLISVHNNRNSSTELRFGEPFCTVCFYKVERPSTKNRGTQADRDDLWDQLLEKAREEEKIIKKQKYQEEEAVKSENRKRCFLLWVLIVVVSILGIVVSLITPAIGASIAAFLAVIAPIVYDKFLKPISKL